MKYLVLIGLLLVSLGISAQVDNPMSGIAIPKTKDNTPAPNISSPSTPSIFNLNPEKKENYNFPKFQIGEEKSNFSMIQEDEFVNRSSEFADRTTIKKEGESNKAFRGNQHFGHYTTKSDYVQIMAGDFMAADGDRIKITVNDRIIISDMTLSNYYKGIQLTLEPGFNKIEFEALNQGTSGPNTAEFTINDDKEHTISSNQWNLATGFKASIVIIKE